MPNRRTSNVGGSGEQWVQGVNHFKVVQDSNVIAHRLQASFKPSVVVARSQQPENL